MALRLRFQFSRYVAKHTSGRVYSAQQAAAALRELSSLHNMPNAPQVPPCTQRESLSRRAFGRQRRQASAALLHQWLQAVLGQPVGPSFGSGQPRETPRLFSWRDPSFFSCALYSYDEAMVAFLECLHEVGLLTVPCGGDATELLDKCSRAGLISPARLSFSFFPPLSFSLPIPLTSIPSLLMQFKDHVESKDPHFKLPYM